MQLVHIRNERRNVPVAWGWGGAGYDGGCGAYPPNAVFFPNFILFLVLVLLVFGIGFWGFGGGAYNK